MASSKMMETAEASQAASTQKTLMMIGHGTDKVWTEFRQGN